MDVQNSSQKLSWASEGNLLSFGFTGTATALQRCRHLGKPDPGSQRWTQSREFCGVAWRCSTEPTLSCRKSDVWEIIICRHL